MPRSSVPVSVIVCTRNRPAQLEDCLRAILASSYRDFELVVVDQSEGSESRSVVERLIAQDNRIRLVHDNRSGASRARNLGATMSAGDLLVFTDDDCEPAVDWLKQMLDALQADDRAGIAFGAVIPAPCDPAQGFIVGYSPRKRQRLTGRLGKLKDGGIGANMAMRRHTLEDVGGFDEFLGPGSFFPACEDGDLAYRVLLAGYALLHIPEARVLHHGLRDWQSGSVLTRRTFHAVAAAYTKHVRRRDTVAVCLLIQQMWMSSFAILMNLLHLRRPLGIGRLAALFIGTWHSFRLDIEPYIALYKPKSNGDLT